MINLKSLTNSIPWLIALASFFFAVYMYFHPREVTKEVVVEKPVIQEVIHREIVTTTQIKEKENTESPDLVYESKDSLRVSVNGEVVDLKPKNKDKFEFGKDYVELHQKSDYSINIDNKPLEPSWGVGVGYTDNSKLAGIITARIKETPMHVWGMSDGDTSAVGIMFSTNYK